MRVNLSEAELCEITDALAHLEDYYRDVERKETLFKGEALRCRKKVSSVRDKLLRLPNKKKVA